MRQLQHKPLAQWNEITSLPIAGGNVPGGIVFGTTDKMNNDYKIRPWFKR